VLRGTLADIEQLATQARIAPPALLILGAVAALASAESLTALATPEDPVLA
jgi:siroheme synthase